MTPYRLVLIIWPTSGPLATYIPTGASTSNFPLPSAFKLDVYIGDLNLFSEGTAADTAQDESTYRATTRAKLKRSEGKLTLVPAAPTLSSLVRALNAIGASPKDLIAILQAMKKSGAIKAELEVI
jgi:flagellar basal body P-ring protein FlgI